MAKIPEPGTYPDPVKGHGDFMLPSVVHYEDLIAFQRQTIKAQAQVISDLTETIQHLQRTFTGTDGVVDARIQDGGHL